MSAHFRSCWGIVAGYLMLATSIGCGAATEDKSPAAGAEPDATKVDGMTAADVMEKMVAVYREAESYMDNAEYGQHFVFASDGVLRQGPPIVISVMFQRPNKFRITRLEPKADGTEENAVVTSDGERLRAGASRLDPQVLQLPAPASANIESIAPDPLLRKELFPVPVVDLFPQLDLLLTPVGETAWPLAVRDALAMLPAKELKTRGADARLCFRVQFPTTMGPQICWIEKDSYLLLRIELPSEELQEQLYPGGDFSSFAMRFDFYDAILDADFPDDVFQLEFDEQAAETVAEFREPPVKEDESIDEGESESEEAADENSAASDGDSAASDDDEE
ncbi:MAG: hypothetical protein ACR2NU_16950 [Aeoliella sp.]